MFLDSTRYFINDKHLFPYFIYMMYQPWKYPRGLQFSATKNVEMTKFSFLVCTVCLVSILFSVKVMLLTNNKIIGIMNYGTMVVKRSLQNAANYRTTGSPAQPLFLIISETSLSLCPWKFLRDTWCHTRPSQEHFQNGQVESFKVLCSVILVSVIIYKVKHYKIASIFNFFVISNC